MAEPLAPVQEPATPPVDRRAKFLASFAKLDPEAELDDAGLDAILADEKKRDEFVGYVRELNPDFQMNGQEFAEAVKKKGLSVPSSPIVGTSDGTPLGSVPGLASGVLGTGLPDQEFAQPQLVEAPAFEPGTQANPAYLNYPEMGAQEPRSPMPLPSVGDSPRNEQEVLDAFPGSQQGDVRTVVDGQPLGKELEKLKYGFERVLIPPDYQGGLPTGTFKDTETGLQYFDRPLSNKVNGKEQTVGDAAAGAFKNSLYEMAQGVVEGVQAVSNTASMPYASAMSGVGTVPGFSFGDEASQAIEGSKTPIADLYAKSSFGQHRNLNTALFGAAEYAPLVVAQVAQTLAPELRAPAAVSRVLGLVTATAFDAQMVHSAHENALKAGLKGADADLYTVLEGSLVIGGFKVGSKLMASLGDKLATRIAPAAFREKVALDAVARINALQAKLGRELTKAETSTTLSQSLRAALPGLAQVPKEMFQQAPTFAGVEAARIGVNQTAAPALGGKAENLTLAQAGQQILQAGEAGAAMGAVTGGTSAVLGRLAKPTLMPGEPAPMQASEAPVDERTFSVRRPTGQVEMENVRVHAVSADGKTAVVRGVDAQGSPIEREVPTDSLREDANKNNASPPTPLPQGERGTSPDAPYQPQPDTRTVSIGEASDGTPMFADVTADGKAVAVHNGSEQFSDLTPFADVLAHDFTDVPTAEQPTTASADPSIIDVTDQAPEPIAPEPTEPTSQIGQMISGDTKSNLSGGKKKIVTQADGSFSEEETNHADESFELDILAHKAAKGKLTFDEFQRSYFGQSIDTNTLAEARKAFEKDPVAFIADIQKHFNESGTAPEGGTQDLAPVEPSPTEPPAPVASPPDADTGTVPAASEGGLPAELPESKLKLYHGTRSDFEKFNTDAGGGMVHFTTDESVAKKYANGTGGMRGNATPQDRLLVDGQGIAYDLQGDQWVPIGKGRNPQDGVEANDLLPLSEVEKPANIPKERGIEDGVSESEDDFNFIFKNPRIIQKDFSGLRILDATTPEGVAVIAGLTGKTYIGGSLINSAKAVVSKAPGANFDFWGMTKVAEGEVGKQIKSDITDQLSALGYDGIHFKDDSHNTVALFESGLKKEARQLPPAVDRTAEREAAQAAVDEYNDGDTATRKGLTGVQQRQAIQELADKAGMSVSLDEKSKATLTENTPAPINESAAGQTEPIEAAPEQPAPTPIEQQKADNEARVQRLKSLGGELWDALGKTTGKAGSLGGGVHPDVARILKEMAKEALALAGGHVKQAMLHIREADERITADVVTDGQLKALVKEVKQQGPQNSPQGEGSRDRAHAKRYDADTQANLTADEKTYVPAKEQISASEKPADYIKRVGEDAAYERALGDPAYTGTTDDAADLLHDNLIRGVAEHFTAVRDAALKTGNTELADDAQQKLLRLAGKLSQTGTRQAKALQARVGAGGTIEALVDATNPAETGKATVDQAYGQIANQNAEHDANNEKDGRKIAKAAVPKRKAKMAAVLETPAVKAAIEKAATAADGPAAPDAKGYGETNTVFTKKGLSDLRARLKGMAFAAPLPPDLIYLGGYHLEASTRKFADWSKKMVREVGARVKPRLAELYAASQAELLKKDPKATGFNTPQEVAALVAERDAPGAVAKGIRKMGKTIAKIAKQHAADIETDRRTLTDKFIQDAGLSGVDAKEMADAIEKEWNKRKEKGAWQAIGRRFQPKRSRARLDALDRLVNDLNAAANLPETTMRSPVAQILEQLLDNKVQISAAEAQEIERLKDAYVKAAAKTSQTIGGQAVEARNTRAVTEASLNLLQAIGKLKNVGKNDWGRDVGAMFYASLLSNPLTHAANFYLTAGATAREVGVISSIHTAAETTKIIDLLNPILSLFRGEVPKLPLAFQPAKALFPGYKRGLGDAHYVFTTGIDVKTKTGATLSDGSYETDPLEEKSYARRLLSKITGKPAPEKSSLRFVRRSLGASDTFMQAGLNEARYKEIAIKQATKEVARRQASGPPMTGKEVRQFVDDEVDRLMFNTPEALADIKAITDNEGLGNPKTVDERAALLSRTGDLLDQARAAQNPDAAADSKEFAARHAGNSNYEGHLGRFAEFLAKSFKGIPAVGSLVVPFAKVTSNFQNRYAEWNGLGFYRAVQGGAGKSPLAFLGSKVGEVESRYQRDYTPEEREKAFLRSTIGLLTHITAYAALKAGYIALTGLPTGNKDEDQQAPPRSIVFLKGPPWLIGKSITYKGMNEESGFTMLAGLDRYVKQKGLAGDSPEVVDKLAMSGILLGAATMNAGPSNGAGDFLGAISKAEISPSGLANLSKRLGTTAVKAAVMPAGLQFALTLYSQSTDANLPEKRSNDAWQQLTMDVFGDIPSWRGGAEDAVDTFGDPMKVATTKFWGFAPVGNDPEKYAVKRRLVDLKLVPNAPRITDPALRIFDVKTRQKATQMTPAEFKEFCQVRGQTLWKEISRVNRRGKTPVLTALKTGTPEEAAREMEYAVETARQAAKDHILAQRVKKGQDVQFGRPKAE